MAQRAPAHRGTLKRVRSVGSALEPLDKRDLAAMPDEDKRAEAFRLKLVGATYTAIARHFSISRDAAKRLVDTERAERISRREQIDEDIEDMVGQIDTVIGEAWDRLQVVDPGSMVAPTYLKVILEATDRKMQLRGVDQGDVRPGGKTGKVVFNVMINRASPGGVIDEEPETNALGMPIIDTEVLETPSGDRVGITVREVT